MKKIFLFGLMLGAMTLGLTSCNDDNDQLTDTRVTNYIQLSINGDDVVYVDANSTYTDAGCKAELAGEDVSDMVKVYNPVNTSMIGPYEIVYEAVNADGFAASAYRTVYVGTAVTGTVANGTYRQTYNDDGSSKAKTAYSGYNIDVLTDGNGAYWVSDLMGGYYEQRQGYGEAYSMKGYLKVNDDNTVSFAGGGDVVGWGDALDDFLNGKYDPATKTLSYTVVYAGMDFNVILNLQ
jgi:hypothetical protein